MKKTLLLLLANLLLFSTLSAQTASQTIRGIVVEKNSGHSVPYATVVVADLQPTAGTTGDSLGRFVLRRVPVGRHDLQVSCLGYEPVLLKEILVGSSKEVVLEIRLQESLVAVEEVVVRPRIDKTEPLNEMALAGGRMLRVEEASRYAGSMDDPTRHGWFRRLPVSPRRSATTASWCGATPRSSCSGGWKGWRFPTRTTLPKLRVSAAADSRP